MNLKLRHHLAVLNGAATRRVVKQFSNKYHLVYFGHVDAQEDEHQLVRGLTVSTTHIDNHYTVGTFQGHDLILVQRRNTLTFPGKPDSEYVWLIMELDLAQDTFPHIFIEGSRHDETFFADLFLKVPQFRNITSHIATRDQQFAGKFKVFALPNQYAAVDAVFVPDITNVLGRHFTQFDFEITEDRVLVYAPGSKVAMGTLQEMLRAGAWLAESLNQIKIPG